MRWVFDTPCLGPLGIEMAEKSCSRVELDRETEKVSVFESKANVVEVDSSSDEDSSMEVTRLRQHQSTIGSVSYASAAVSNDSGLIKVSFPDINTGLARPRPRTVFVHGSIGTRVLVDKLAQFGIVPLQVQSLLNSDIAVTFKSVADKQSFLNLDCVVSSELSYLQPVWVRIHFKPAEMKSSIVRDRLKEFGTVLFFRENRIMGTDVLTGSLTAKMKLREPIPSFLYFGPISLAVNYDGQTPTCRKCDSTGHIAKFCQIKRCFNCGKSGHLNRQCPETIKCQGCSSSSHCFEQCPSSWDREEVLIANDTKLEVLNDSFLQNLPDVSNKSWSSQVDAVLNELPVDSSIWSPPADSQVKSSSGSEGNLVIDESEAEVDGVSLKRSRDLDEASFVTVSHRRPCKKKPKEPS